MECRLLQEDEATGTARELYQEIEAAFGMVPNFFKAQAAVDAEWAMLNWRRVKHIMLSPGPLDRKTREIIAMVVSVVNGCQYCHLAHQTMALMAGASPEEIDQAMQVVELYQSFNAIADSLQIPCDITPALTD